MRFFDGKGGLLPLTVESDPEEIFDGGIAGYKNEDGETIELLTREDIEMLMDCYNDDEEAVIDIIALDSRFDDRSLRTVVSSSCPMGEVTVTKQSISLHNGKAILSLSYNNQFTQFVSTGNDKRTVLYDVVKKKVLWSDTGTMTAVSSSAYSPVRDHFLVSYLAGDIRLFDATNVTKIKKRSTFTPDTSEAEVRHIEYFPCGSLFVASGPVKGTHVFDIASGKIVANYDESCDVYYSTVVNRTVIAHAPDTPSHSIKLFDIRRRNGSYPELHGHSGSILSMQTSANENEILSSGLNGTTMVHDLRTGKPTLTMTQTSGVDIAIFAGDRQRHVVTGARDRTLRFWDTLSGSSHCTRSVGQIPFTMCYSNNQLYYGSMNGDLVDVFW